MKRNPIGRAFGIAMLLGFAGFFIWNATRPKTFPETPRMVEGQQAAGIRAIRQAAERDAQLVRQLIREDLGKRRFHFSTVLEASSGKRVLKLDATDPVHAAMLERLNHHLATITQTLSQADSPVRTHRRINEVSRHFEDGLIAALSNESDWQAEVPPTRDGRSQRSGYPDIRVVHQPSGKVFYLDPKLVEDTSWDSSFRSFYFEPKTESLKITDDAVHLLVAIGHDGNSGEWAFTEWKIVDLASLQLRLKPEFQASNADLYPEDSTE